VFWFTKTRSHYVLPTLALRGPGFRRHTQNPMARPAKSPAEKRAKRISFAVNETEYKYFQELAGHGERVVRADSKKPMPTRKRSIAGIIRQLLKGNKTQPTETGEAERKALFQIAGMARNLNQIAAQANAQGFAAVAMRTNELADQLRNLMSVYDRKS
jgi:hypothetical protein